MNKIVTDYGVAALAVARGEIGTKESPPHSNKVKYSGDFKPDAWCADFVTWCLNEVGFRAVSTADFFTRRCRDWEKAAARRHLGMRTIPLEAARPGDIVTFEWPDVEGRSDHIGFVAAHPENGSFTTVEGNTSPTSDSDGGEVMERTRKRSDVSVVIRLPKPHLTLGERLTAAGFGLKSIHLIASRLKSGYQGDVPGKHDSEIFRRLVAAGFGVLSARNIVKALRRKKRG
jgi:hypothetical protein